MSESSTAASVGTRAGTYRLGVDLGTTYTAAAVADGVPATMVGLGNRALQIPSVLFLADDGEFLVGEVAERRGVAEPDRVVREFKRRIGDHVPLLVAGSPYSPQALAARLLRWVLDRTTERMGGPPESVVLTHPANWGPYKLDLLRQVGVLADLDRIDTCPEPQAAAAQYAARSRVEPGQRLVVYDLGGGTFDVCVLEQTDSGFQLLGSPEGIEQLGGVDFDEALFQQVLASLGGQVYDLDPEDPAVTVGLGRLRRDCVEAKEALSTDVDEVVPVTLPGVTTSVRVTRSEFESLIRPSLRDTIAATHRALRSAGVGAEELAAIVLVGGSSRIPLVGEMLQREFGVTTALDTHPKHDVAMGALLVGPAAVATSAAPVGPESQPAERAAVPLTEPTPESVSSPEPAPTPESAPTPEPAPEPIPGPTPVPAPDPEAEPAPTPAPAPESEAEVAPTSEQQPEQETEPEPDPASAGSSPPSAGSPLSPVGVEPDRADDRPRRTISWPAVPRKAVIIGASAVLMIAVIIVVIAVLPKLRGNQPNTIGALPDAPPRSSATPTPTASPTPSSPAGRPLPGSRPLKDTEMIISMQTDGLPALYLADTGKPAPVERLTHDRGGSSSVIISPDRRSILYLSSDDPDAKRNYWIASAVDGDADRVRLGKRPDVCAGAFYRGAWNPVDPTMIAVPCTDADGAFGLYLMGIDGKVLDQIPIGNGNRADDPTFSPDGRTLVFWRAPVGSGGGSLFAYSMAGDAALRQLTPDGTRDADPAYSPDGETIAFRRRIDNNSDIYTIRADGEGKAKPVVTTEGDDQDPSWSPDGQKLIFKGDGPSDYPGERVSRVWIVNADGSGQRLLWTEGAPDPQSASAWSRR